MHPREPLRPFRTWRGSGHGESPTRVRSIRRRITFPCRQPFVPYLQRTPGRDRPAVAAETGYLRRWARCVLVHTCANVSWLDRAVVPNAVFAIKVTCRPCIARHRKSVTRSFAVAIEHDAFLRLSCREGHRSRTTASRAATFGCTRGLRTFAQNRGRSIGGSHLACQGSVKRDCPTIGGREPFSSASTTLS